jgi:hypothetical protein
VTASDSLNSVLRTSVGPTLRDDGFKGSGGQWTLAAPNGDLAIVNVQRSQHNSQDEVRCIVNLAVVPAPWWAWERSRKPLTKTPKEHDGLWRDRLDARGGSKHGKEEWWLVRDEATAEKAARDMIVQLTTAGVPKLRRLLDRQAMLDALRCGDVGFLRGEAARTLSDVGRAVILADEGGSGELDDLIDRFTKDTDSRLACYHRELVPWLRRRAEASGSSE